MGWVLGGHLCAFFECRLDGLLCAFLERSGGFLTALHISGE